MPENNKKSSIQQEQISFSNWINKIDLNIDPNSETDLYVKCSSGQIFIKILKLISDDLVDDEAVEYFELTRGIGPGTGGTSDCSIELINLTINTLASLGCRTSKFNAEEISSIQENIEISLKTKKMVLDLLWELIRTFLLKDLEIDKSPKLFQKLKVLLKPSEILDNLYHLDYKEILTRWFNYHLSQAGSGTQISNFSSDIKSGQNYQILLEQLQKCEKSDMLESGDFSNGFFTVAKCNFKSVKNFPSRARQVLKMADNLGCKEFIGVDEIVSGHGRLNAAFVMNLFNNSLCLYDDDDEDSDSESNVQRRPKISPTMTPEESIYKNWINSLDLGNTCHYIYNDLKDGIILLKILDCISPGLVKWNNKVTFPPFKNKVSPVENCCYVVELSERKNIGLKLNGQIRGH